MILSIAVLAFVTLQRLGELVISNRHTSRLKAKGAHEVGAGHYPWMVVLHAAWLAGLWGLAWDRAVSLPWLGLFALLQALRVWTIATLGERWTTRIIILPGAPRIRRGPYRFLPHPNYAVVIGELAVLPLAFGLTAYAAVFTALNLAVLWIRIRAEDRALKAADAPVRPA